MALPETLWLSPTSLAKVDNDNYRAFVIDKAHLPHPENQSGSKRLITESMASTENRIHVIRKLVPGLRTASDKASVASQCSLLPRRTIRSTGKGAIARRFKPALHAVSPH